MFQAIVKKGKVVREEVPQPMVSEGNILIKVAYSCVSSGTEMSGVEASSASLVEKFKSKPEQMALLKEKLKKEGLLRVISYMRQKSSEFADKQNIGKTTGYSVSGIVLELGKGVTGFAPGDRVAAAGMGFALHAEYVVVPKNLVVKAPDDLHLKYASTVTVGSIALQGVRRVNLVLGEFAVVLGSGLLGLLSVQFLRASGIRVAAVDIDPDRLELAKAMGCELIVNSKQEDPVNAINHWTGGKGADGVIFTATTTDAEAVSSGFRMTRRKGRLVMVGVGGDTIRRGDMYSKELDYLLSASYGPGRYDPTYEEKGIDYPYAYVRWTENRNMGEYLRMIAAGVVNLDSIIGKVMPFEKVSEAFDSFSIPGHRPITVVLEYEEGEAMGRPREKDLRMNLRTSEGKKTGIVNVALVGAGGFATGKHLPNLAKMPDRYKLCAIADLKGHNAKGQAERFGAVFATTSIDEIIKDTNIDLVMICTRHDNHTELALKALAAGKHVFVEKPLAVTVEQTDQIRDFYANGVEGKPILMVGFNRRFSKFAIEIDRVAKDRTNPLIMYYRMNAGFIPLDMYLHDHGGRIVGEGCHLIDLMNFLTKSTIDTISFESMTPANDKYSSSDNKVIVIKYRDGSVGTLAYFANGSKDLSKEYLEVHFDGKSIIMDNYETLTGYGVKLNQANDLDDSKGHMNELIFLHDHIIGRKNGWPISLEDLLQTTYVTLTINNI
ncbi:MAG: zinc-binding dehydrogenase [Bacteroidetes bacterium]|nr:zinc-binding dehydrogenase [Bacteroidota bacterium]